MAKNSVRTDENFYTNPLATDQIGGRDQFFAKPSTTGKNLPESPRTIATKPDEPKEKKPFDKKKWRLQKYSKKYKLQQWEERRKKVVLQEYYRDVRDDGRPKFDVQKIYADADSPNDDDAGEESNNGKKKKPAAHVEFQRITDERRTKREEFARKKAERDAALKVHRKQKAELHRRLSKKTKRGQPVMKERLEMLLEQIQRTLD